MTHKAYIFPNKASRIIIWREWDVRSDKLLLVLIGILNMHHLVPFKKIFFEHGGDKERKLLIFWLIGLIYQWQNVKMTKCIQYVFISLFPVSIATSSALSLWMVDQPFWSVNTHVNLHVYLFIFKKKKKKSVLC